MNKKTEDYVIPLLVLFFIFLFLVQGISFYLQTQDLRRNYQDSQDNTQAYYAMQANMTSRSLLDVTGLLAQRYVQDLILLTRMPDSAQHLSENLGLALKKSLGEGFQGYMLYDDRGRLNYVSDSISDSDHPFVQNSVDFLMSHPTTSHHIFVSPSRNLFTLIGIEYQNQRYGYLALRRPFSYYTDALNVYSPGFSLALIEARQQRWLADDRGERFEAISETTLPLKGSKLDYTSWQVVTVADGNYLFMQIMRLLYPKLLFLAVYICLAIWSMRVIRYMQRTHRQSLLQATEQSVRAEQALSCLEEMVITTDMEGRIIYGNKSSRWLLPPGQELVLGSSLAEQIPLQDAAWMGPVDEQKLLQDMACVQELLVDINGKIRTLALSYQLIKHKKKHLGIVWLLRDISPQVADRELLEESRTRYRALYEGAGVGMWHVDIATVRAWLSNLGDTPVRDFLDDHEEELPQLVAMFELIDMNQAAMKLHDIRDKSVIAASVHNIFSGPNRELVVEIAEAVQQGRQQFSVEARAKNLNGQLRYYVVNVTFDSVGLDQALISFVDISDRIEAEQALKESERFWSQVLMALPDSVYVNDLIERRTVYSSRHVGELLGYDKEEVGHFKHWRELVREDDKPKVDHALNELRQMQLGEVLETQLRMQHKNGSNRVFRFRDCVFTTDIQGYSKYYVGIGRDVTEEENAKHKLAFSERQYRLLAEGISDIVISLDRALNLTFASPSVEKILGARPDQVMQEGLKLIFDPESLSRLQLLARKDLHDAEMNHTQDRSHHKVRSLDLHARSALGKTVMLEVQSSILLSETGDIEGILAIGRDVTQRRKIEQEVREAISDGMDQLQIGNYEVSSRAYCGRFNFKGNDQQKRVGELSGGERGRLQLACILKQGANMLLLDEPSNDLDVETLRALEEALLSFPGCAIVISHDRWFLDRIATHILAYEGESQLYFMEGNYADYLEDRKRRFGAEAEQPKRIKYKRLG